MEQLSQVFGWHASGARGVTGKKGMLERRRQGPRDAANVFVIAGSEDQEPSAGRERRVQGPYEGLGRCHVMGTIQNHERPLAHDLKPSRPADLRQAPANRLIRYPPAPVSKLLKTSDRDGGIGRLMFAKQSKFRYGPGLPLGCDLHARPLGYQAALGHLSFRNRQRGSGEPRTYMPRLIAVMEVQAQLSERCAALLAGRFNCLPGLNNRGTADSRQSWLDDPRLFRRNAGQAVAELLGMVIADTGYDGDFGQADIGGIEPA